MSGKASQGGFTLVEVLAAFAILALSLGAIYQALSSGLIGSGRANEMALLALEARSKMVEIGTIVPLEPSGTVRQLDSDGRWTFVTSPVVGLFDADPAAGIGLFDVELTGQTASGRIFSLRTYKLGYRNQP